jgi:hypothetical protein
VFKNSALVTGAMNPTYIVSGCKVAANTKAGLTAWLA